MILERFSGNREQVGRKVAQALAGLYAESAEEAKPAPYEGGRKAAWMALERFSVQGYAGTRNKIHGNVSRLSFYIRHGVLGLREVAEKIRERSGNSWDASKFWQELGWRQFWQLVYARLGNRIYTDLEPAKVNLGESSQQELPEEIQKGKTGLVCMDESVRELVETGYMHNHARMWFASFVIHFRKLGWKTGEKFFYRHLLDGDPASNALSWQWVASTFSHRPYLFNKENIQDHGGEKWCERCRAQCPFNETYPELERRLFSM